LGFLIGAKLGELEQVHPWIYGLAGGMFVYIGLADMVCFGVLSFCSFDEKCFV
jgi:hypothetical protein